MICNIKKIKTYVTLFVFFFLNITIRTDRVYSRSIVTRTRAVESPIIMSSTENFSILCIRNPSSNHTLTTLTYFLN